MLRLHKQLKRNNMMRDVCRCRGEHLDGRRAAKAAIAEAHAAGGRIGAFFCESVLSCGGQVRISSFCKFPTLPKSMT